LCLWFCFTFFVSFSRSFCISYLPFACAHVALSMSAVSRHEQMKRLIEWISTNGEREPLQ
jgi:hypothetical protein